MLTVKQEIVDHLEKMGLDEQRLLLEFVKTMKELQYSSYSANRLAESSGEERGRFIAQAFELITEGDYKTFHAERKRDVLKQVHDIGIPGYQRLSKHIHELESNNLTFFDDKPKHVTKLLHNSEAKLQIIFGFLDDMESELGLPKLMMLLRFEWRSALIAIRESAKLFIMDAFGPLTDEQRLIFQKISEDTLFLDQWCAGLMDQYIRATRPGSDEDAEIE